MNKLRLRPRLAALLTTSIVCLCLLALSSAPAWAKVGVITEFTAPAMSFPFGITAGPDGNLWFTEGGVGKIGRITPKGKITEFSIPAACGGFACEPIGITAGPDGNLWFAENATNKIGRITTAGSITEFTVPTASSQPFGITAGPDGNLWFLESATTANKIGRITTAGVFTEFPIPTASSVPSGITAGPPARIGTVWFTEHAANKIGKITTS